MSTFLQLTFELRKVEYILTAKGQFEKLTRGHVEWPDLIDYLGTSCCISQEKHNDTSHTALPPSVKSYWRERFRDLWWRHMTCRWFTG